MVVHYFSPGRGRHVCEFEAHLVYIVSSRAARAPQTTLPQKKILYNIIYSKYICLFCFMCGVFCLFVCLCSVSVQCTWKKRVSDTLGLELTVVVSYSMGAWNWAQVLWKSSRYSKFLSLLSSCFPPYIILKPISCKPVGRLPSWSCLNFSVLPLFFKIVCLCRPS